MQLLILYYSSIVQVRFHMDYTRINIIHITFFVPQEPARGNIKSGRSYANCAKITRPTEAIEYRCWIICGWVHLLVLSFSSFFLSTARRCVCLIKIVTADPSHKRVYALQQNKSREPITTRSTRCVCVENFFFALYLKHHRRVLMFVKEKYVRSLNTQKRWIATKASKYNTHKPKKLCNVGPRRATWTFSCMLLYISRSQLV